MGHWCQGIAWPAIEDYLLAGWRAASSAASFAGALEDGSQQMGVEVTVLRRTMLRRNYRMA